LGKVFALLPIARNAVRHRQNETLILPNNVAERFPGGEFHVHVFNADSADRADKECGFYHNPHFSALSALSALKKMVS
jgi:hypothetical protein